MSTGIRRVHLDFFGEPWITIDWGLPAWVSTCPCKAKSNSPNLATINYWGHCDVCDWDGPQYTLDLSTAAPQHFHELRQKAKHDAREHLHTCAKCQDWLQQNEESIKRLTELYGPPVPFPPANEEEQPS